MKPFEAIEKGVYDTTKWSNSGSRTYIDTGSKTGLGINSMMPDIAAMYTRGKIAIVSNVGPLVKPTTKIQADNNEDLPVFLFAHNHQKRALYTAQAETLGETGWAGKIADNWMVNSPIGLNL